LCAVVTIALSFTIFELFDIQNIVTLKSRLGVITLNWKWHHSIDRIRSYSSSILTMAVPCTVFELKRDICRKTPIFHTPLHLTCTILKNPFEFLPQILIQIVRVPELLSCAKILPKSSSLCLGCNVTDDRLTDGSCMP